MRAEDYIHDCIEEKIVSWLAEIRSKVAPRPRLDLRPRGAALLVVDMQRYFAAPEGRCYLDATAAVVPRIRQLLDAWRANGGAVVFTRHGHTGDGDLGMLGRFFSDYIKEDEPESEIIEALAPLSHETVIPKKTYDAFLNTSLESKLKERGIDQVVVTGVLTHMCVETTARAAFCRGFEVYLPADASATTSEALHKGTLLALADAAAVVTSVAEVLKIPFEAMHKGQ